MTKPASTEVPQPTAPTPPEEDHSVVNVGLSVDYEETLTSHTGDNYTFGGDIDSTLVRLNAFLTPSFGHHKVGDFYLAVGLDGFATISSQGNTTGAFDFEEDTLDLSYVNGLDFQSYGGGLFTKIGPNFHLSRKLDLVFTLDSAIQAGSISLTPTQSFHADTEATLDHSYEQQTRTADLTEDEQEDLDKAYNKKKESISDIAEGKTSPIFFPELGVTIAVQGDHFGVSASAYGKFYPTEIIDPNFSMFAFGGRGTVFVRW